MRAKPGSGNRKVVANHKKRMKSNIKFGRKRKKKGCYIATCVYGSYDCSEVWVLRRYRDETLDQTLLGKGFIHLYYLISPYIVSIFGSSEFCKEIWKKVLDSFVIRLKEKGVSDTPYKD